MSDVLGKDHFGYVYLSKLCASILRFWLDEHTTAILNSDMLSMYVCVF